MFNSLLATCQAHTGCTPPHLHNLLHQNWTWFILTKLISHCLRSLNFSNSNYLAYLIYEPHFRASATQSIVEIMVSTLLDIWNHTAQLKKQGWKQNRSHVLLNYTISLPYVQVRNFPMQTTLLSDAFDFSLYTFTASIRPTLFPNRTAYGTHVKFSKFDPWCVIFKGQGVFQHTLKNELLMYQNGYRDDRV